MDSEQVNNGYRRGWDDAGTTAGYNPPEDANSDFRYGYNMGFGDGRDCLRDMDNDCLRDLGVDY